MKTLLATAVLLCASLTLRAGDLIADIKAQIADTSKPITLIVDLPLSASLAEDFKKVVEQVGKNEPGTVRYLSLREPKTGVITVVETYKNLDAFSAHLAQPYIVEFIAKLDAAKVEAKVRIFADAN
jgi:quinol monooxygenase YgiN